MNSIKKTSIILLLAIMLIFPLTAKFTFSESLDENDSVISVSEEEILRERPGAQMRLLQLQRRVEFQSESAQYIINAIEDSNSNIDTSNLIAISEKFEALLILIKASDLNRTGQEIASEYVLLKSDAINITCEFKNELNTLNISEDLLSLLRSNITGRKNTELKVKNWQEIEKYRREYNSQKARKVAMMMGINESDLEKRIISGEFDSAHKIKEQLKSKYYNLTESEKLNFKEQLNTLSLRRERENNNKVAEKINMIKEHSKERNEKLNALIKENRKELNTRINQIKESNKEQITKLKDQLSDLRIKGKHNTTIENTDVDKNGRD